MNTLLQRLFTDAPLMSDGAFTALLEGCLVADLQLAEHPVLRQLRESMRPQMEMRDGVAVIPVEGTLAYKPGLRELFSGVEDTGAITDNVIAAAENPQVRGILLKVDSPGGFMAGGFELADAVKQANRVKPVVAWTGSQATSLAYLVASQAGEVVSTRTATLGSIGVVGTFIDRSKLLAAAGLKVEVITNKEAKYKAIGALGTAMSDEQREYLQGRAQVAFNEFKRAVHSTRPSVPSEAMQGQCFLGSEAKGVGLVDCIGDMSFAMSILRRSIRARD